MAYEPNLKQLKLRRWVKEQKRRARREEELKLLKGKKQTMPRLKDVKIIDHRNGGRTVVYKFEE